MLVTFAFLLATAAPLLAAGLWRRRRVRVSLQALSPGRAVAYATIARSRRRF